MYNIGFLLSLFCCTVATPQQNSNLSVRYNADTDMIQCLLNGAWVDFTNAGIQWDGYVFKYNTGCEKYELSCGSISDGYWYYKATSSGVMVTTSLIDVTNLSKLKLEAMLKVSNTSGNTMKIGLSTANTGSAMAYVLYSGSPTDSSYVSRELDLSEISGEYYIKFYFSVDTADNHTVYIKNLYFEK